MGGDPSDTSPEQFFAAGRFCYDVAYSRPQLGENVDTPLPAVVLVTIPASALIAITSAPVITRPVASDMIPVTSAVQAWPRAIFATNKTANLAKQNFLCAIGTPFQGWGSVYDKQFFCRNSMRAYMTIEPSKACVTFADFF